MNNISLRLGWAILGCGLCVASANAVEMAVPCVGADGVRAASDATSKGPDRWRYPFEARRQRAEGTVVLHVELDTAGVAKSVKLAASSGSSVLDRAALKAAKSERFCKLQAPSEAMSGLANVSVSFSLNVPVASTATQKYRDK